MTILAFKESYHDFAQIAEPYLHISNSKNYGEALELIETLLEEAEDSLDDPTNIIIEMLSRAIEIYENQDVELAKFTADADTDTDVSLLRTLMEQHDLRTADLPEIGSKSMVSRVLSGQRQLNKKHISELSKRFNINPNLFF